MADNVDVIQGLWDAFGKGDLDRAVAGIADDGEVVFPESLPWGRHPPGPRGLQGRARRPLRRVRQLLRQAGEDPWADDDHVTVIARATGRGKGGKPFEGRIAWIYQLRDGKVIRAEAFPDTAAVLAALA